MAVVAVIKGIRLPSLRDLPLMFGLGFFAVSLHHVAINFGQQGVSAGASSVLAQTTPLFSTLIARFVFKDQVSLWRWGCVLLGLFGVVIVVAGDHGLGSIDAHGLLILLAAVSWSLYFALQKHHTGRYDGLTLVCYTVWSGTVLLLVFLPGACGIKPPWAPMRVQWAVIALGMFPSALAYLAWAYVLAHVDLSRATMTLYLMPPTAMVIASYALGERPTLMIVVGGAGGVDECVGVESGAAGCGCSGRRGPDSWLSALSGCELSRASPLPQGFTAATVLRAGLPAPVGARRGPGGGTSAPRGGVQLVSRPVTAAHRPGPGSWPRVGAWLARDER